MERVTDIHIHIQPWEQLKPQIQVTMRKGHEEHFEFLLAVMKDPRLLLEHLDRGGIWRVGLINYPSPDLMGFTDATNDFVAEYASHDPQRLLPIGGVHPRLSTDPEGDVRRLNDLGIRCLKIHPPHQLVAANAYTEGLEVQAKIYATAEELEMPVMVHTGTSIFPGARCKFGRPMELDDVALDFPRLQIIMAHGGRPIWMEEAFFLLRRHRNLWLDLSGIPPKRILDYFPRIGMIGDRVLWGTDWPSPGVRDLRANLEQFRSLPIEEELKTGILETNSLRLFPA